MVDDKDSVQLFEYCLSVRETLKSAIRGKNLDNPKESEKVAMDDLERYADCPWPFPLLIPNNPRVMRDIEHALRMGTPTTSHTTYDKKVKSHVQNIQHTPGALNALSLSPGGDSRVGECGSHLTSITLHDLATMAVSETGASLHLALGGVLITSRLFSLNRNNTACGRLITRTFTPNDLPSLIEAMLSSEGETARCLPVCCAQMLIDVLDEVRSTSSHHECID